MTRTTSKPGPPPTTCLTCRRRRKKCDLSKPCCETCLKGGYECLGYENNKPRTRAYREYSIVPKSSQLQRISPTDPPGAAESEPLDSALARASENRQVPTGADTDYDPRPSILGAALRYRISGSIGSANDDCTHRDRPEDIDYSWPQDQSQITVYSRSSTRRYSCARQVSDETFSARFTEGDLGGIIETVCQSIPSAVDATRMLRGDYIVHIINECE
ncbi:hypothetical protein B0J17DRAFT_240997 [Rhizoctonia solani]|nr:hypothetical protein B0J17DRAFT_240997 [Rhizoctonia solani]